MAKKKLNLEKKIERAKRNLLKYENIAEKARKDSKKARIIVNRKKEALYILEKEKQKREEKRLRYIAKNAEEKAYNYVKYLKAFPEGSKNILEFDDWKKANKKTKKKKKGEKWLKERGFAYARLFCFFWNINLNFWVFLLSYIK